MTKVIFDMSMSLDGFVKASNATPEQPLGEGGERLHEWGFGEDERDREVLAGGVEGSGAIIAGRRTYDDSVPWWGADGPTGLARRPLFVVTHEGPAESPAGGVYRFVTDGIESAVNQAKAAAAGKSVGVHGADTIQQCLNAGLLDEISVDIAAVLLGSGVRLFDHLAGTPAVLGNPTVIPGVGVTHLRYPVRKA